MAELKFEITENLGVLSENAKGWTKELNKVSWGEHAPKYDIRDWSPDHTRMSKGVTLTDEEFEALKALLSGEEDDIDESEFV
ncbi:MAG: YdbC family protein [Ruminococcus sp.]|nr:YdbC family protein [Ruminococcus sp.]